MDRTHLVRAAGLGLLALSILAPAGRTAAPPIVFPEGAAVLVNGKPIAESVIRRALGSVPPDRRAEVRPGLIEHLVNNLLIDLSLKHAGYKVENAEVDKRVKEMKATLKQQDKDLDNVLADLKMSEPELREVIAADLRWHKYASAKITDAAMTKFFNENKDMFDGSTVRAQHILLSAPKDKTKDGKALGKKLLSLRKDIEREVKDGLAKLPQNADKADREKERHRLLAETFARYAKDKSDCPSKNQGGSVGPFPKAGFMVAPFANAAFALKPYQMSDVVETPFGYHLILCVERKAGREVEFKDVKEAVKEVFLDRLHGSVSAQLRKKAVIYVKPVKK